MACLLRTLTALWRPTALLLLTLGYPQPVLAFFCFSFGGHGDTYLDEGRYRFPPPPLLYPMAPPWNYLPEARTPPPIKRVKPLPEIIQGYRFRPLATGAGPAIEPH